MKKRILPVILALLTLALLCSCGNPEAQADKEQEKRKADLKIGVVLDGDAQNPLAALHIAGVDGMKTATELGDGQVTVKTGITADKCYETITQLVKGGCNMIFAAGTDFEDYAVQAATENETVQFCVANGKQAETLSMANVHSYTIPEYLSAYAAGVAAGSRLLDRKDNGEIGDADMRIGFVGGTPNPDNTSFYSAFFLGAKSICPEVQMQVQFSGAAHSENLERIAASALIANGCILIAQQSYTNGAAETCEKNQIDFIGSTVAADKAPNFAITSTQFNGTGAYTYAVNTWAEKGELPTFWSESTADVSGILALNEKAFTAPEKAKEATAKVQETEKALADGTLHVFDTTAWTVDGKAVETTAGEESDGAYQGKKYIKDGYFHEYELSPNPKFAFSIDGVSVMN